jgi:hypothetical protein
MYCVTSAGQGTEHTDALGRLGACPRRRYAAAATTSEDVQRKDQLRIAYYRPVKYGRQGRGGLSAGGESCAPLLGSR